MTSSDDAQNKRSSDQQDHAQDEPERTLPTLSPDAAPGAQPTPPSAAPPPIPGEQPTLLTDGAVPARTPQAGQEATMATNPAGTAADPTRVTEHGATDMTMATAAGATGVGADGLVATGTVWGDFRYERLLGKGGMGAVYLGTQLSLDRPVAIKVLPQHLSANENFRKRFALEAKAVAKIASPHVVQVFTAGEHQGHNYFVMEYVEGEDLAHRLKHGFQPTFDQAVDLILQASRGLVAAGQQGIIHRDIKPGNMMVTADGHLKLMDFGLVKLAKENTALTMTGTVMGTVSYFSPEQGRGERCDQRTDIYAMGVVLYELATRRLPFTGNDATSIIYQHIHEEPPLPQEIEPSIPEDLQAVVLKCMQKDPANRYQSADELVADLEMLQRGQAPRTAFFDPAQLRSGATMQRRSQFSRERDGGRSKLGVILAVVVALGAAGAGGWWMLSRADDPIPSMVTDSGGGVTDGDANDTSRRNPANDGGTDSGDSDRLLTKARAHLDAGRIDEAAALVAGAGRPGERAAAWDEIAAAVERERAASSTAKRIAIGMQEAKALLGDSRPDDALSTLESLSDAVRQAESGIQNERDRLMAIARRMKELLSAAEYGLIHGDLATARSNYLASQQDYPNRAAARGSKVVPLCEQFDKAIANGNPDHAAATLVQIEAAGVDPQVVAPRRQRLAVLRQVTAIRADLARNDLTAATRGLDELRRLDAGNPRIAELAQRIEIKELVVAFDRALANEDLDRAQGLLAEIKKLDDAGESWRKADERLAASRLVERRRAEAEARRQAAVRERAAAIEVAIAAEDPDLAAANEAIDALASDLTAEETGLATALRRAVAQRQRELGMKTALEALDRAVHEGDRAALKQLVADPDHAAALTYFIGKDDLVFDHRIDAFHHGEAASVDVTLTNALALVPENVLHYRYQMEPHQGGWRITAVEPRDKEP